MSTLSNVSFCGRIVARALDSSWSSWPKNVALEQSLELCTSQMSSDMEVAIIPLGICKRKTLKVCSNESGSITIQLCMDLQFAPVVAAFKSLSLEANEG